MSNLVRIFDLQNNYLDKCDPWSGIISATDFFNELCTIQNYNSRQAGWF